MAHPRGARVRSFSTSARAVVRESEWMVMTQRVANELKPLIKLAKDQGWTVEASNNGTKMVWRGPDGQGPVYTGYRCQGRDLANYRAELVRNGLRLDEEQAQQHVTEQSMEAILASNEDLSLEDLNDLLNKVTGALAYMHAKAISFDEKSRQAAEWQEIAIDAQKTAEEAVQRFERSETLLDAIRQTFALAPWAILPEIAKLLGIDAGSGSPLIPTVKRS